MLDRELSVEAVHGGLAAGRDQYIGISLKELPALIAASTAPLERQNAEQREQIVSLSGRLGTTEGIVRAVLAALAPHLGKFPPEALPAKVARLASERHELLTRQTERVDEADATSEGLERDLAAALAAGDDGRARLLLEQKRDLKRAGASKRQEAVERMREAVARDLFDAAEAEAALGQLAQSRLDYLDAAAHFSEAARIVAPLGDKATWRYLLEEASNLEDHGHERGDNEALRLSIARYRTALDQVSRADRPDEWATIQNNLGNALSTLGGRESGTARLEEAVTAYRASLEEWTRDRAPLEWAATQNNLANALQTLGAREIGTVRLEEAVAAHCAALKERRRERAPLDWATSQNNLGNALWILGERETGTERLERAVDAFRTVLEEWTRERVPLLWATAKSNLANALCTLGERERSTARLEEAVAACHAAMQEWTRDRVPLDWATTQHCLGNALKGLVV